MCQEEFLHVIKSFVAKSFLVILIRIYESKYSYHLIGNYICNINRERSVKVHQSEMKSTGDSMVVLLLFLLTLASLLLLYLHMLPSTCD